MAIDAYGLGKFPRDTRIPAVYSGLVARFAALLVVVSLLSPALATIACDAVCAFEAGRSAAPMDMATCHEHQAEPRTRSLAATSDPCHDGVATLTAVLADSLRWIAIADVPATRADSVGESSLAWQRSKPRSQIPESPPLISTLRI
jgi:hypothetical protein